jgi:autotransporter-like protein/autochaperone domain-containing protein
MRADRKALLLGSALASTLLFAAPGSASAQQAVFIPASPVPVVLTNTYSCIFPAPCAFINTIAPGALINFTNFGNFLSGGVGIGTSTVAPFAPIAVQNFGDIATAGIGAVGIAAATASPFSPIAVLNSGDIATIGYAAIGISANAASPFSPIAIINSGDIATLGVNAIGIQAATPSPYAPIAIYNSGDIATLGQSAIGISANANSAILINNSGDITTSAVLSHGISASTGGNSPISIINSGMIEVTGSQSIGINAATSGSNGSIEITNSGGVNSGGQAILAYSGADSSPITIENSGNLVAQDTGMSATSYGALSGIAITNSAGVTSLGDSIYARTLGVGSGVSVLNSGDLHASAGPYTTGDGIYVQTNLANSPIDITNLGHISSAEDGIDARSYGANSPISIVNQGTIDPDLGITAESHDQDSGITIDNSGTIEGNRAGIVAYTGGANSPILITNSGTVTTSGTESLGIALGALAIGPGSDVVINNSGGAKGIGPYGVGIYSVAVGGTNEITNSGTAFGDFAGILAVSYTGTKIVNSGDISAGSLFAIGVYGASAEIQNSGRITGYVELTDNADTFVNQSGGTFEARLTSDFGGGGDVFVNESGGTVHTAADGGQIEHVAFVNLESFENQGLISLQDGQAGDSFEISNTVGQRNLAFTASGNSTLAVDTFLGGPGSISDTFTINGNVSGQTLLTVHDTNPGPGAFNEKGIPVVYANGNVKDDAFYLKKPIDTGLFEYDLFFKPTGSGIFELKSLPGGGAHVLPHLLTNIEDVFHTGTETWFDRTADLRVLLHGGGAPYPPQTGENAAAPGVSITPAVWVRGSGNWIGRDGTETTKEYGRTYEYDLRSDLSVEDFQTGIDLGKRDLLSQGDILVFGILGGWVHGDVDYDRVNRQFNMSGAQAGAYATYLKGGLFVDTLFKADILKHEQQTVEFPGSLDATSFGVRTDTGYRFGSFRGGAFIEPLATIGVIWSDLEDFTLGGNHVNFDSDPNVRGRLGLRVGTSTPVWTGTTMEPFVIGSVWGNLSGQQTASVTSNRSTFNFEDSPEDVWGEMSAGVNFFNPSAGTSVFAKFDATFADNLEGFGGKAGMRVSW